MATIGRAYIYPLWGWKYRLEEKSFRPVFSNVEKKEIKPFSSFSVCHIKIQTICAINEQTIWEMIFYRDKSIFNIILQSLYPIWLVQIETLINCAVWFYCWRWARYYYYCSSSLVFDMSVCVWYFFFPDDSSWVSIDELFLKSPLTEWIFSCLFDSMRVMFSLQIQIKNRFPTPKIEVWFFQ